MFNGWLSPEIIVTWLLCATALAVVIFKVLDRLTALEDDVFALEFRVREIDDFVTAEDNVTEEPEPAERMAPFSMEPRRQRTA